MNPFVYMEQWFNLCKQFQENYINLLREHKAAITAVNNRCNLNTKEIERIKIALNAEGITY